MFLQHIESSSGQSFPSMLLHPIFITMVNVFHPRSLSLFCTAQLVKTSILVPSDLLIFMVNLFLVSFIFLLFFLVKFLRVSSAHLLFHSQAFLSVDVQLFFFFMEMNTLFHPFFLQLFSYFMVKLFLPSSMISCSSSFSWSRSSIFFLQLISIFIIKLFLP